MKHLRIYGLIYYFQNYFLSIWTKLYVIHERFFSTKTQLIHFIFYVYHFVFEWQSYDEKEEIERNITSYIKHYYQRAWMMKEMRLLYFRILLFFVPEACQCTREQNPFILNVKDVIVLHLKSNMIKPKKKNIFSLLPWHLEIH